MLSHYLRTRKGHQELKVRTYKLTARQRALLLIIESVQWNDSDTVSVKQLITGDNLQRLLDLQLIEAVNDSSAALSDAVVEAPVVSRTVKPARSQAALAVKPTALAVAKAEPALGTGQKVAKVDGVLRVESAQQQLALFDVAEKTLTATGQTVSATQPVSAEEAELAARKSVFMSYLPYLGGSKPATDIADKPVVVAAEVATQQAVVAVEVAASSDKPASVGVIEHLAVAQEEVTLIQPAAELAETVIEAPVEVLALQVPEAPEVVEPVVEVAAVEAEAVIEVTAVSVEVPVETDECQEMAQVAAQIEAVVEVQQAVAVVEPVSDAVDTPADVVVAPELVQGEQSPVLEAGAQAVAVVNEAAVTVQQADAAFELQPAVEVVEHQPVNVISRMTISAVQPLQSLHVNRFHQSAHVQVEVQAVEQLDDGMLYIGDHNKKWQERHIPLLIWTVTMPGATKKQKKLELPLKFYNMDEFDQVWDAKPPYGAH